MNFTKVWLLCLSILAVSSTGALFAQNTYKLHLRNGTVTVPENLKKNAAVNPTSRTAADDQKRLVVIQFDQIPDDLSIGLLRDAGIELLEYIPENAYTATIEGPLNRDLLLSAHARSVIELEAEQKIQPVLLSGNVPAHAINEPGKVDLRISFAESFLFSEIQQELNKAQIELLSDALSTYGILEVRIASSRIREIAGLPWIQYIEAIPAPTVPLNDRSEAATRANILTSSLLSGYNLSGEGVVIGIGDDGDLRQHIDVSGRLLSHTPTSDFWHGLHVAGTVAGEGLVNEKFRGYAPKSAIVMRGNSEIWKDAANLVRDYGMVITTNSYGPSTDGTTCAGFGKYTNESYVLDRQASQRPNLQHIFAAGNSGAVPSCNGLPAGFGTVLGDYASAKNIISVGRTTMAGIVSTASSRGPAMDGRIKPELMAPGTGIFSTFPADNYQSASGTSMAAPAIAGGLGLLYQRYRQLHSQANPKNALMKALLLNGATDKGLPGPDYSYGFGMMNLLRSVKIMESNHYFTEKISNQQSRSHQITVPSNTALVKVMLYWNDPATSMLAGSKMLINNLDIKLVRPDGTETLPLSPFAADPTRAAAPGRDSLNNVEQIVLENPSAGTYTLHVSGKKVPMSNQEYFLVYDVIETSTIITYPVGSERLMKNDAVFISWDSYGNAASTFGVSYSLDNGSSWNVIDAAVPAGSTQVAWTIPAAATGSAKVRVQQNATGSIKESGAFTILDVPVISFSPAQCEGYAAVQWTVASGATDYEVMRLVGREMKSVAFTSQLKYVFQALSPDSTYYITVRPRLNGIPGRRAVAISRKPDNGSCDGSISDNDLALDSLISPKSTGRAFTGNQFLPSQSITVRIRNYDDQAISLPFEVGYAIGDPGSPVHWETVRSGIPARSYLEYTFAKTADMQNVGAYQLNALVKIAGDVTKQNNSISQLVRQLSNDPITLPFFDDLESLGEQEIIATTTGLTHGDRYGFIGQENKTRLRTYLKPAAAFSGTKSFTLDVTSQLPYEHQTFVDASFNLSRYQSEKDEIRLTFRYKKHGFYEHYSPVGLQVRGKETDPWIFAFDYRENSYLPTERGYTLASVDLSEILRKNAQEFSPEFQVRWNIVVQDTAVSDGYTFDDIRLFKTSSDVELVRVIAPDIAACISNASQRLTVVVKNNGSEDSYAVPFKIRVDDGYIAEQKIPVIRAGRDTTLLIDIISHLQMGDDHHLKAWVDKGQDLNHSNDSVLVYFKTPPAIAAFPYFENFENGDGGWQTLDPNSAWQYGHPNSIKVNEAASGQNAWKTNLTGPYQNDGISYLYSPCIRLNRMARPMLSFSISIDLQACENDRCDVAYVEYNFAGEWKRLGDGYAGANWYQEVISGGYSWNWNAQDLTRWHTASVQLPFGYWDDFVRLRFVIRGGSSGSRDGIAIDDIHIYDSSGYIEGSEYPEGLVRQDNVNGNEWIHLIHNGMVAAVNPEGQDLGTVTAKFYTHTGAVRNLNGQYYLNRNFKITSSNIPERPVNIRLYVTDAEIEKLIAAPDKTGIAKPRSAYDLAITKYSGANEDGTLSNNGVASWSFYSKSALIKIPYEQGYYVEFKVKSFSEFWFAKEFLGTAGSLPVELSHFSAKKMLDADISAGKRVLLEWRTAWEKTFSHFEIERAAGQEKLMKNEFSPIGNIAGKVNSTLESGYIFIDKSPEAGQTNYYRLKMVDQDGSVEYSSIRAVNLENISEWKVFPNPTSGKIILEFDDKKNGSLNYSLIDLNGRTVKKQSVTANGFLQKHEIDISDKKFSRGLYLLRVKSDSSEKTFKILKE